MLSTENLRSRTATKCQHELQIHFRWLGGVVVGASDSRSRGRGFDPRPRRYQATGNDSGQVVHTHLPRRRQSSLLYGVVKPGTFTFTFKFTFLFPVLKNCFLTDRITAIVIEGALIVRNFVVFNFYLRPCSVHGTVLAYTRPSCDSLCASGFVANDVYAMISH